MQTSEWMLAIGVIVIPLIIAVVVTLWSLEQVRYRPKKWRPPGAREQGDARGPVTPPPGDGEAS